MGPTDKEPGPTIPHLFRTESGKITAVLCKSFGIEHLEIAEDLVGETFLSALEIWPYQGVPPNPTAWLYSVAKNKARNYFNRRRLYTQKIMPSLKARTPEEEAPPEIDLSEKNITDSQLQMLFTICHPSLSTEAQVSLALRVLCGFGIDEIASAFLTNKETVNKRLSRAKEKLRMENMPIEFPGDVAIAGRLDTVLLTIYLLYNEGYYSESQDTILREDLCKEAMRLTRQLLQNESTHLPPVNALFSLMSFHSSRFPARTGASGELTLYEDQDESLWDQSLITQGAWHLHLASRGNQLTKYHLEAGIAYQHTLKADTKEKWDTILQLYNRLLQIEYSPIAALNRTFALSKVQGAETAIREAEKLQLTHNHYYHTLLGELYKDIDPQKARAGFEAALPLARTHYDKQTIQKKLDSLSTPSNDSA